MKINITLIFISLFLSVSSFGTSRDSIQDIMPYENPEYIGYRIAVTNLSVISNKKAGFLTLEYTLINTGRQDLLVDKKISRPPSLVVNFDETLRSTGLISRASEIRDAIIENDFQLASGKILSPQTIKIKTNSATSNPVTTADNLENPRLTKPVVPKKETFTAKAAPVDDFEMAMSVNSKPQFDENACSDLVFESIKVVKKSKNKVTLEYTIVNQGEGPATLISNRKKENKNMALQAHLSSRDKLTKGSLTFDGTFIQKGLTKSNGQLYPGEKYTSTIKLNIQKMTKFTPYIILELDPYLSVYECNKTNNKVAVKVGEGIGQK